MLKLINTTCMKYDYIGLFTYKIYSSSIYVHLKVSFRSTVKVSSTNSDLKKYRQQLIFAKKCRQYNIKSIL